MSIKELEEQNPVFQELARTYIGPTQWLYAKDEANNKTMIFCWIQKGGCTHFKEVHKRLTRLKGYTSRCPMVHKTWIKNTSRMLMDERIKKFMFYRDPMQRFLSGYLDKCHGRSRSYCRMVFKAESIPFREAVFLLKDMDANTMDGHFSPQTKHCGGLNRTRVGSLFSHVAELKDETSNRQEMKTMLHSAFEDLTDDEFNKVYPRTKVAGHAQDAVSKMKEFYNDTQLIGIVVNFFLEDYVTFNILPPEFAQQALLDLRERQDPFALKDENLIRIGMNLVTAPAFPAPSIVQAEVIVDSTKAGADIVMTDTTPPQRLSANPPRATLPAYYLFFVIPLLKLMTQAYRRVVRKSAGPGARKVWPPKMHRKR